MLEPPRSQAPDSDSVEDLFLGWLKERAGGGGISFDELCERNPPLAGRLKEMLVAHDRAEAAFAQLIGSAPTAPGSGSGSAPTIRAALGRYDVRSEIAHGGMGIVLEAYDPSLRRTIAVKIVRDERESPSSPRGSENARRQSRLVSEAQILAQLDHPGVVAIHEVGLDERGAAYFTMKRVRGEDFGSVIRAHHAGDAAWTLPRAVGVIVKVCEAVAYAHTKGVIHRDLKPSNVLVGRFGEVFVMDWGLAKVLGSAEAPVEPLRGSSSTHPLVAPAHPGAPDSSGASISISLVHTDREHDSSASTQSPLATIQGEVVGTPAYMPPEQARGDVDALDARADVYATGAMLYHLLAGRHPYADEDPPSSHEILLRARERPPTPLARLARRAPEELVAVCEKAMAREPAGRYASMLDLAEDLRAWLEGRVVRAHRTGALIELKKWIGRNRAAAAAILILVAGFVSTAIVQTVLKREVQIERSTAEARAEALRRQDYFNRMALAADAVEKGDTFRARGLLKGSPEDLRGWEWHVLSALSDTSDRVIPVSTRGVSEACWTPDGRSIVTLSMDARPGGDNRMMLWDAETAGPGLEIESFPLFSVSHLSFSADGRLCVGMHEGREVRFWDVGTWTRLPGFEVDFRQLWPSALFAPQGRFLVAAGGSGPIEVWDADRRERVLRLDVGGAHTSACWSPDGWRLYIGHASGALSVWTFPSGELVDVVQGHIDRVFGVGASPDGRWFCSAGADGRVIVRDAHELTIVHQAAMGSGTAGSCRWSPDSRLLAVASRSIVRLIEAGTWSEVGRLQGHEGTVNSITFDDCGSRILTGDDQGTVRLWELDRPGRRTHIGTPHGAPQGPSFSRDGRWFLVSWFDAGLLELWSAAERRVEHTLRFPSRVGAFALSPDGSRVAMSLHGSERILVLDPWTDATLGQVVGTVPQSISFDPTGSRLSVVGYDATLAVYDATTCEPSWHVQACECPYVWPYRLGGGWWSPDGTRLLTCTVDGRLQLFDAANGALLLERKGKADRYWSAQFESEGRTILAAANSRLLERWRVDDLTVLNTVSTEVESGSSIAIGAHGRRIFSLGSESTLVVLDAETGHVIASLPTGGPGVAGCAASPVDDLVVTVSKSGVRFWDTKRQR